LRCPGGIEVNKERTIINPSLAELQTFCDADLNMADGLMLVKCLFFHEYRTQHYVNSGQKDAGDCVLSG
jgi:hypothetical protein